MFPNETFLSQQLSVQITYKVSRTVDEREVTKAIASSFSWYNEKFKGFKEGCGNT